MIIDLGQERASDEPRFKEYDGRPCEAKEEVPLWSQVLAAHIDVLIIGVT